MITTAHAHKRVKSVSQYWHENFLHSFHRILSFVQEDFSTVSKKVFFFFLDIRALEKSEK